MKSVYAKILLWCFATLCLSLVALGMVAQLVFVQVVGKGSFFERINVLLLEQASGTYETGGPEKLGAHLKRADTILGGEHHLIDSSGKDLATGADLSELTGQFQFEKGAVQPIGERLAAGVESADGRYRMIALADSPYRLNLYLPYYLAIFALVAILCWALAVRIASPLRDLTRAVERFGQGDLTARVNFRRRDELGQLSAAFDQMAERIGSLLTSERRLLQDVSHELRSPLARLSFAAELVRTATDQDAAIARIKKEVYRLSNLVDTLVEAIRAENDPQAAVLRPESLNLLLREVVEDCRLEAEAGKCVVNLEEHADVTINADREQLRRAFENVLRNAVRYSPKDSLVGITIELRDVLAQITFRDFGPGVPEEMLTRIFDPFFRVDDSRSSATGGFGLGLTITDRAVKLHDGRVWAENAEPGLKIVFEIPVSGNQHSSHLKAVRMPATPAGSR